MLPPSRFTFAAALCAVAILWAASPGLGQAPVPEAGVSADQWAAKARLAIEQGLVFEAIDAFDHAVAVDPGRQDIRIEYATLLKKQGFWLRCAEQYKTVLKGTPGHTEALLGYGELLNAEYQFSSAVDQFSKALQQSLETHDRERALVGLGSARFGLEDFAGAAAVFEGLLKERPRVMSAVAYLAIAQRRLGRLDESDRLWGSFLDVIPSATRAKIQRIEVQELRAAIEQARASVHADASNAPAWAHLGRLLRRQPDLSAAVKAYEAAARLSPLEGSYRFHLGTVLRDLSRWKEASVQFDAVGRDPKYRALAHYNLAYCSRRSGDAEGERKAWGAAATTNVRDLFAYRRYVRALAQGGDLKLELARVSQLAEGEPGSAAASDPVSFVRLSLAQEASGNLAAAREASKRALRLDINDVRAQRRLRDLMMLDRSSTDALVEEARRLAAPGAELPPDRDEAARDVGAALLALGREADAEPLLRRLLGKGSQDAQLMVAVATCMRSRGQVEGAVTMLRAARAARPDYLYGALDLAVALLELGRGPEAVGPAREAVQLDPRNPIAQSILGAALRNMGDLRQAAAALESAVSIDPIEDGSSPRLMLAKVYGALGKLDEARGTLEGDLPEDPEELYLLAWQFVRDHYHDRSFHGQDWDVWRDRFQGRLRTTPDAYGAIALMLASLDDRNTRLRSPQQTASLMFTQRGGAPEFDDSGVALTTSQTIHTRRLEDNMGYIAVTNLDDPKASGEILKAVEEVKGSDGVILDLRGNKGGADSDVAQIAGMFLAPGTETGKIVAPSGTVTTTAIPPATTQKQLIPDDKPVVVLVDRNTASSAESLAGSLKESGRAVLVGEKTFGKAGIQSPLLLPGGAIVLVVSAEHADRSGSIYSGVGIRPDVEVAGAVRDGGVQADLGGDPAVTKARGLIKRRKGGS